MPALGLGESIGCSNPALDLFLQIAGVLVDPVSISFQIFDDTTGTPVQVYPVSGQQAIDLSDCPTGGRLSIGHYAAAWSVPMDANIGGWEIRWFVQLTPSDSIQEYVEPFEVLSIIGTSSDVYCTVLDLRNEGVTTSQASDARLANLITMASRFIDRVTKRFFNPRELEIFVNGTGTGFLFLDMPIIAIDQIEITIEGISFSDQPIDLRDVAIYNRHLNGLTLPDDRDNPKIAFKRADPEFARLHALLGRRIFYEGRQNVRVKGVFGYTDPGLAPMGHTPELISHACKLLAIRNVPLLADIDARQEMLDAYNVRRMRTRDQEIEYQSRNILGTGMTQGPITGDQEIDNILLSYAKNPDLGVA